MTDPLRLSEFLPYRLSVLSNTLSRRISEYYALEFDITISQWRVIAVLGETPELTATEITQRTVMDKVAVSRAVAGLIDMGYLARLAAQSDGRRSMLKLTAKGKKLYNKIVPAARAYEAEVTQTLSPKEIETFNATLTKIAKLAAPDRELW